ncbi:hypothetical protein D3C78_1406120 [compost metagenome]
MRVTQLTRCIKKTHQYTSRQKISLVGFGQPAFDALGPPPHRAVRPGCIEELPGAIARMSEPFGMPKPHPQRCGAGKPRVLSKTQDSRVASLPSVTFTQHGQQPLPGAATDVVAAPCDHISVGVMK